MALWPSPPPSTVTVERLVSRSAKVAVEKVGGRGGGIVSLTEVAGTPGTPDSPSLLRILRWAPEGNRDADD